MKILTWLCLLFSSLSAFAIEIHVSLSGSDIGAGTATDPVVTLDRSLQIAREYCGKQPVTIFLHEGIYRITSPVVLNPEHSGSPEAPVTITSFPGEKAVLTSSVVIPCSWRPFRKGIIETDLPSDTSIVYDRMFVNGALQSMARYPNRDTTVRIFEGYAPDAIDADRVRKWNNPIGGILHVMHASEWGGFSYKIKGKDETGKLILEGGAQNNRSSEMHPSYRMVENIFEELDAPGEWFCDRQSGKLYFFPPSDFETGNRIEMPQSESLIMLQGEKGAPIRYVNITNLHLTGTVRTFQKTSEPLLRSDWTIYRSGAVRFENTDHCTISDCRISDIGGNAIFMSGYNKNNTVSRNHIFNVGANAVCLVGLPETVRNPRFDFNKCLDWNEIDTIAGPCSPYFPEECNVSDNLIHHIGTVEKQVAGVEISMSSKITVSHNSIYHCPRAGINISEGTWGGHLIEWNDVFDTVLETGDHGSFNSWGRDRFWQPDRQYMDSIVACHPSMVDLDAINTTVLRNNRWRCDRGWDIDLDDGSSNYHIYNNLCLNGGLKCREGFNRRVENNIIVNNSYHPHVWFANSKDEFKKNIVTTGYFPVGITTWDAGRIDNNFFIFQSGLIAAQKNGTDVNSISGDPMFVSAPTGDYRILENSSVKDIGFQNFPMDMFGVRHEPLKGIAETPVLPHLGEVSSITEENKDKIYEYNRVAFKTITTEGERSATGVAAVRGVLVLKNDNPAIDLRANDVIIEFNGIKTDSAEILHSLLNMSGWETASATRFRDQKKSDVILTRKHGI